MRPPELRRRVVLHLLAAGGAAAALPLGCDDGPILPTPVPETVPVEAPRFFSDEERLAVGALANHVIPEDDSVGGAGLGAVEYIELLLTAFEHDPPRLHAGGPFSGRVPLPDASGQPSSTFPDSAFATFVPLDRVTLAGLRLYLYGSKGTDGGGPNDEALGPITGLRDLVGDELRAAMKAAPAPLETLDAASLAEVWNGTSQEFRDTFAALVAEAALSAPEYGGNKDLLGWKLAYFDGDSAPLGYSFFDEKSGKYLERPDKPLSTADAAPDPHPLSEPTLAKLDGLVKAVGGVKFS